MKTSLLTMAGLLLMFCGCRSVAPEVAAELGKAGSQYIVRGEVKKPGYISCSDKPKTLMGLISEAGGLTDYAKASRIRVEYAGSNKVYSYRLIKTHRVEDPIIRCGATIIVPALHF